MVCGVQQYTITLPECSIKSDCLRRPCTERNTLERMQLHWRPLTQSIYCSFLAGSSASSLSLSLCGNVSALADNKVMARTHPRFACLPEGCPLEHSTLCEWASSTKNKEWPKHSGSAGISRRYHVDSPAGLPTNKQTQFERCEWSNVRSPAPTPMELALGHLYMRNISQWWIGHGE